MDRFFAYVEFVEENPLYEDKIFKTTNGIVRATLRKDRPMTIASFCIFLGVTTQAWRYWRKNRDDLAEAIELIEDATFVYKFERAAVGIFKANIISRELRRVSH
ncbi:DNA-packaging protein gp3 [Salinihabitans flavidus]|uniref:DNA-packaging protein gp3 n=1 Tax=Salinihabitans flavidus TaxID=569882 RepID=A0A1H8WG64_9RHOB|nr:DNA-packaging protein gp3 [Salinihabitans flavidus]